MPIDDGLIKELEDLRSLVDSKMADQSRVRGMLDETMKQMKDKFGVATLAGAEKKDKAYEKKLGKGEEELLSTVALLGELANEISE
jgi:hypothetical protein